MNKTKIEMLRNTLTKLSKEFNVEKPQLLIPKIWKRGGKIGGYYTFDTITLNHYVIDQDIAFALKTLRHEFAHYLQDLWNIEKKLEVLARRFEKDRYALGILPKSQTKLFPERSNP